VHQLCGLCRRLSRRGNCDAIDGLVKREVRSARRPVSRDQPENADLGARVVYPVIKGSFSASESADAHGWSALAALFARQTCVVFH
jgi:hypothetical protein